MYGLTDARLLTVEKGYRNESHAALLPDGRAVNVIIYKREPGILATLKRANLVGDYLAAQSFPARYTQDRRILRLGQGESTKYAALYGYLPGQTIPWEAYTMSHLKHLGSTMSTMHTLLKNTPFVLENKITGEYLAITKRMETYFAGEGVRQALRMKLGLEVQVATRFYTLLKGCAGLPDQQPLHMDFVRGNILFDNSAHVTGVLDFEKTAWGHPLFDVARTLAFLLVDCRYKSEVQIRKYFLISGYNKSGVGTFKITPRNTRLLEALIDLFLLYDFYKFLRHNPYESLPQNEHFMRTCTLLQERTFLR